MAPHYKYILPPRRTYAAMKVQAEEVWQEQHNPKAIIPVPFEFLLEFKLGFEIEPKPGIYSALDIFGYLTVSMRRISVDSMLLLQEKLLPELRITLAHEYAHATLHFDLYKSGHFKSIEEFKEFYLGFPKDEHDRLEQEADEFSYLLLVPPSSLAKRLRQMEIRRRISIHSLKAKERSDLLKQLATEFCVTVDAVKFIMDQERYWER